MASLIVAVVLTSLVARIYAALALFFLQGVCKRVAIPRSCAIKRRAVSATIGALPLKLSKHCKGLSMLSIVWIDPYPEMWLKKLGIDHVADGINKH